MDAMIHREALKTLDDFVRHGLYMGKPTDETSLFKQKSLAKYYHHTTT